LSLAYCDLGVPIEQVNHLAGHKVDGDDQTLRPYEPGALRRGWMRRVRRAV
jgi:hypothetical protein